MSGLSYTYKPGTTTPMEVHQRYEPLNEAFETECGNVVAKVRALGHWGAYRIAHIADLHSVPPLDVDRKQLLLAVVRLAQDLALDAIVLGGDILNGTGGDAAAQEALLMAIIEVLERAGILVIILRGNHDDNSMLDSTTQKPVPENIVTNEEWGWRTGLGVGQVNRRIVHGGTAYFYVDDADKRIRIIGLDSNDLTDEERLERGGQNWQKLSAAQLQWLDEEALAVPEGWKAIIACHVTPVLGMPHNLGLENRADLYTILEKHKDIILAYLCGHGHMDAHYVDPGTGIPFIMSATAGGITVDAAKAPAGFGYASISDEAKAASPTGKWGFDIVIINADGSIDRVRFGAQPDTFADETTTE